MSTEIHAKSIVFHGLSATLNPNLRTDINELKNLPKPDVYCHKEEKVEFLMQL